MSRSPAAVLAWSCVALSVGLATAGALVATVGAAPGDSFAFFVLVLAVIVTSSVVGGLVASRRPANPIGWILCGFGVFMGLAVLAAGYAHGARDAADGAGEVAAWFANSSWVALLALAVFVLLLFPDGLLLSRRWRLAAWCGGIGTATLAIGSALDPGPLQDYPEVTNPVGADATLAFTLQLAGTILTAAAFSAAVGSVVLRYRRADTTGRLQIKWLAVAGVFTACGIALGVALALAGLDTFGNSLVLVATLAIPVAIGVAVLRYRLYDVDRVISRSLTYALVTVTLAGAYVALVLAGQALFSAVAGGSNLAIAVSTLIVAALFLPLRARVQRLVDRRFYRRRYDAQRTLEAFGARLRAQIELDSLRADLQSVVHDAMQPQHVSVSLLRAGTRNDPVTLLSYKGR